VNGTVAAGAILAGNDLTVNLYKADGTSLLGTSTVDAAGHFTIKVANYDGVVVAKVSSGAANDYLDVATGQARNLSAKLMAVGTTGGDALAMNVNALSTVAALKAGAVFDGASATSLNATTANDANTGVATAFGLFDPTGGDIVSPILATGAANPAWTPATAVTAANRYGALLAALSGTDTVTGSMQATINNLAAGLSGTGTNALLSNAAIESLVTGGIAAGASAGGSGASTLAGIVTPMLAQGSSSLTVSTFAGDNILNAAEQAKPPVTMTGSVASGGSVKVNFGGTDHTAIVDGTALTWSYTLTAADFTAMGQGSEIITATSTANGVTSTARRAIVVDTVAPAATITDNVPGTATGAVTFTFGFSEAVTGFDASDVTVSAGTKGAFTAVGPTQYTLVVTPPAGGTGNLTVSIAASAATDLAGNPTAALTSAAQAYDTRGVAAVASQLVAVDVGHADAAIASSTDDGGPALRLDGAGIVFDLAGRHDAAHAGPLARVDLGGGSADTLVLTHADVIAAAGPHHPLFIDGNAGDTVVFQGKPGADDWIDAGTAMHGGHTYDVYRNAAHAEVLVDHAIARTFAG
jgi:hypothetical protein